MANSYIFSAKRTPIGAFNGALSSVEATQLGSIAIKSAVETSGVSAEIVDECIMGQVLTAGAGQAPTRQAWLGAGYPNTTSAMTINKVCGSGLKSVMLAQDALVLKRAKVVVAGGQENMSLAPHLLKKSRSGYRMGHIEAIDSMIADGLWDPYNNWHMGCAAELCAKEYKVSREEQDEFAKQSYLKAQEAQTKKLFDSEITAVEVKQRKSSMMVELDEEPGKARFEKMPQLRPAFNKEGTITAANASKINDGACALVLGNEDSLALTTTKPLVKITAQATFSQDPKWFTTAPIGAMKKLFELTGLTAQDVDLYEINEAFSVVAQVCQKEFKISDDKLNVHGGSVALGHPIGASGARILTTLIHAMIQKDKAMGMASICIGGGEAVALLLERV